MIRELSFHRIVSMTATKRLSYEREHDKIEVENCYTECFSYGLLENLTYMDCYSVEQAFCVEY